MHLASASTLRTEWSSCVDAYELGTPIRIEGERPCLPWMIALTTKNIAANKRLSTEAGTIGETTSQLQVYAFADYARANVASLLIGSAEIATCHIPACTSQFFERLEPNKPSDLSEARSVQRRMLPSRLFKLGDRSGSASREE